MFMPGLRERLERRLLPPNEHGCRLRSGPPTKGGYGRFSFNDKLILSNRAALIVKLGRDIKPGLFACHDCDVRACCTYDHIYEGTRRQNADDAILRNRTSKGVRQGRHLAILSEIDAQVIRAAVRLGHRQIDLARSFGVGKVAVNHIVTGRNWGWQNV